MNDPSNEDDNSHSSLENEAKGKDNNKSGKIIVDESYSS